MVTRFTSAKFNQIFFCYPIRTVIKKEEKCVSKKERKKSLLKSIVSDEAGWILATVVNKTNII